MALVPSQRKKERILRELSSITFEKRWDTKWSQIEWTELVATPYGTLRTPLTPEEADLCRLPHPQLFALLKEATAGNPAATAEDRRRAAAESSKIRNVIVAVLSGHAPVLREAKWERWTKEGSSLSRTFRARLAVPTSSDCKPGSICSTM
jgi:hypothetical protein